MTLNWPENPSTSRPGESVRQMLDYLCWICGDIETLGSHGGPDLEHWRKRVGTAYRALVNPMLPGYGDPYPMDVPPSRSPGLWPDVAASDIPGMTVRHQLVVIGLLAAQSRSGVGVRTRTDALADLEGRISRARTALDHGPARPMPAEARTAPSKALLDAAQAEAKAIREHARRRSRAVRGLLAGRGHGTTSPKVKAARPASPKPRATTPHAKRPKKAATAPRAKAPRPPRRLRKGG